MHWPATPSAPVLCFCVAAVPTPLPAELHDVLGRLCRHTRGLEFACGDGLARRCRAVDAVQCTVSRNAVAFLAMKRSLELLGRHRLQINSKHSLAWRHTIR